MLKHRTLKDVIPANGHSSIKFSANNPNNFGEVCFQFFGGASVPILVLSLDLRVYYANPAAQKIHHWVRAGSKGASFKDYVGADVWQKMIAAIKKVKQKRSECRLELNVRDAHGDQTTLKVTVFPLFENNAIAGFWLILRDVSQERQIQDIVHESQKMEAMQYLVSGTTKELQHPLLAILKRIESLMSKYHGRSFEYVSFKEFTHIMDVLSIMRRQIKNCYETTEKLTRFNKKRLKFEQNYSQPNVVIREVVRIKEQNFKNSNVTLKLRLFDKLPTVNLGELELNQILGHIVDNALQALPAGGQITIATVSLPDSQQVKIEISDNGVGISPEDLPHIFEPFFTTKQRGVERSAGLGLSIVYSLVKAANGQIHVKSSLRKGTIVQLVFPVARHPEIIPRLSK